MARKDFLASSRKLRRKRLIFKAIVFGVIFVVFFSGIVAFFRIPYFQVVKIELIGNNYLIESDLIEATTRKLGGKYLWLFPKNNIFLIPKDKILAELMDEFKRIKKINIDKKYFNRIVLRLEERNNSVLYCVAENCAYADESGFIFEKAPFFSGAVFLKLTDQRDLNDGGYDKIIEKHLGLRLIDENKFNKIAEFAKLTDKIGGGVLEIILKKENIYEFYTQEGWKIILNNKNEIKGAYLNLIATLDSNIKDERAKLDYIDLRLGNKIYFKYK